MHDKIQFHKCGNLIKIYYYTICLMSRALIESKIISFKRNSISFLYVRHLLSYPLISLLKLLKLPKHFLIFFKIFKVCANLKKSYKFYRNSQTLYFNLFIIYKGRRKWRNFSFHEKETTVRIAKGVQSRHWNIFYLFYHFHKKNPREHKT